MTNIANKEFEVVSVDHSEVACDGGSPVVGHPLVYLHIKSGEKEVVCPYCSCIFRLKTS